VIGLLGAVAATTFSAGPAFAGLTEQITNYRSEVTIEHDGTIEVHETIDGPDGKYVCLGVQNAREVVALRTDLLAEATGKAAAGSKEWTAGMQVALLGTTLGRFKMPSGEQGIYVLPFDWLPTPGVGVTMPGGDRRMGPGPPDRPDRPDRPGPPDRADRPGPRGPGGWGPGR
jgi:hypothetical protein